VRVRPTTPRPKAERRDRRRRPTRDGERQSSANGPSSPNGRSSPNRSSPNSTAPKESKSAGQAPPKRASQEVPTVSDPAQLEREQEVASAFVSGLVTAFGFEAEVSTLIEEDEIEVALEGDDLGLLIGPRGQTLAAVQELTRTVVHHAMPERSGWLRVDVGGYRQRRKEALERFTVQLAEEVVASGEPRALEAMGAADRKIVHDAAQQVGGVVTLSEGEEPHRRVVITRADTE
jgi:spoIIIJ-associated protein